MSVAMDPRECKFVTDPGYLAYLPNSKQALGCQHVLPLTNRSIQTCFKSLPTEIHIIWHGMGCRSLAVSGSWRGRSCGEGGG